MNIFVSDFDSNQAAKNLDDKRLIKMVLESTQLLSTAMNILGYTKGPYKTTHVNHPCSIWARENSENFLWLTGHFHSLCNEYSDRFNKIHKCEQYLDLFYSVNTEFPLSNTLTKFPNCTIFKDVKETTLAYRLYLTYKWNTDKRIPKWTNSKSPQWYKELTDVQKLDRVLKVPSNKINKL